MGKILFVRLQQSTLLVLLFLLSSCEFREKEQAEFTSDSFTYLENDVDEIQKGLREGVFTITNWFRHI